MTYNEALAYWYGRINYEVRAALPGDFKLERMRALLRSLGNPHERVRLVHVTGTKGKGSTSAMIASILRSAGYRVGLFTSPHLEHVEERIQVNGEPITRNELAARITEVADAVRTLEDGRAPGITFFEIGTALGFLHFCYRRCDAAVIEVGLGGRFDSTNVCHPLVSVITNVGFDHMAQLGNTLEAIAFQKAGIIKHCVPLVSGVTQSLPSEVIRKVATELSAPLVEPDKRRWNPGLLGAHQIANAAIAVAAVEQLRKTGMCISDRAIAQGLREVKWPARVEVVSRNPVVILDTAHNVPSAEALVNTLRDAFPNIGTKRVVFAVSSDKQYTDILRILAGYFDHFHLTKYGNNPRCVQPEKLSEVLTEVAPTKSFSIHSISSEALIAARTASRETDLICVTGSVFLAGELRSALSTISS